MKLIIIAAGKSSRLRTVTEGSPKTLLKVNGKTILDQIIENSCFAGINHFVVITGYRHEYLENYIKSCDLGVKVDLVYNPDWDKANGISVFAGKPLIPNGKSFMISMSDHIYNVDLFSKIAQSEFGRYSALVGLDFKVNDVYDIDDAMKVSVSENKRTKIISMGKSLKVFNAIDCGVFKCKYQFFDALEKAIKKGDCGLSDGCNVLINEGKMGGVDIGNSFWLDVDTPESIEKLNSINISVKSKLF
jgi:choline kinase